MAKNRMESAAVSRKARASVDKLRTDSKPQKAILSRMQADASRAKSRSRPATLPEDSEDSESPELTPRTSEDQWPLAATNEASKFRALKVFDRLVTTGDAEVFSSEELSEALGRPDQVQLTLRFKNVVGTPQVTLRALTSFDGLHESAAVWDLNALLPYITFNVASNSTHNVTLSTLPNVRLRYSLYFNTGSAEVRAYARSVTSGRRRFAVLVLDKVIAGTSPYYSEAVFHQQLGAVDKMACLFLADQVTGTDPIVQIAIEESPDGINWFSMIWYDEVELSSMNGQFFALDDSIPRSKLVRFKVTLGGTNPGANIKLYAIGRGQ